ncbi:MAG TPA: DUF4911 domain-containing protein [Candidatus Binataceae bacterium]|nr:DUF4911 domain-containing protein [Candidatus Binataceae bacterium]
MQEQSAAIMSIVLEVQPEHIAMLKAVVESYDNLVTLRTVDPMRHHLKLWFSPAHQGDVDAILAELSATCATRRIG